MGGASEMAIRFNVIAKLMVHATAFLGAISATSASHSGYHPMPNDPRAANTIKSSHDGDSVGSAIKARPAIAQRLIAQVRDRSRLLGQKRSLIHGRQMRATMPMPWATEKLSAAETKSTLRRVDKNVTTWLENAN